MSHEKRDDRETEDERLDRELDQLRQELRVAMPGVQVLFAFLLAVSFQQRFEQVTEFQRDVYFCTLLASALFIAPTAYHRLMSRGRDKPRLVLMSSRLALAGLLALAIAMNGAILLVTDVLFDGAAVVVTVAGSAALFVGLWFDLGIVRRMSAERSRDAETG